jgi:hypothetical protein
VNFARRNTRSLRPVENLAKEEAKPSFLLFGVRGGSEAGSGSFADRLLTKQTAVCYGFY